MSLDLIAYPSFYRFFVLMNGGDVKVVDIKGEDLGRRSEHYDNKLREKNVPFIVYENTPSHPISEKRSRWMKSVGHRSDEVMKAISSGKLNYEQIEVREE